MAGNSQDAALRQSEKDFSRAEAEIARIKSLRLKTPNEKVSSILVDNGSLMVLEALRSKLEKLKAETKEEVGYICSSIP